MTEWHVSTPFRPQQLGIWSDPAVPRPPDQVAAYAAATNDPLADTRQGAAAPPVFALLTALEIYPPQVERLFGRTLASLGSVHGEHDLFIDEPIHVGHDGHHPGGGHRRARETRGTAVVVRTESRGDRRRSP